MTSPDNTNSIVIIGAGGHAKVVVSTLHSLDEKPSDVFVTAAPTTAINLFDQVVKEIPHDDWWQAGGADRRVHIAIGRNIVRKKMAEAMPACKWATIIHPTAIVHESAKIGAGVFISARTVIQPDVVIGDHTIINTGAIVEHDTRVGSYCHIAPSATLCGHTVVGEGTLVGAGGVTIPRVTIGSWAAVGAGSAVVRSVADNETVFGNPAHRLPLG